MLNFLAKLDPAPRDKYQMNTEEIIKKYIAFFEKRGHKRIPNSPLVPENDPTTLFTSSGMQPLVPYLLGEPHPLGKRLVNVQNSFRAQDIDEVGDNRHTTFFRMLGNWSLGDYFKNEQLPWFFEFLIDNDTGLGLDPQRLYISVFEGYENISKDEESANVWKDLFKKAGIDPKNRIYYYGVDKNWWSRSGEPENMPIGEPGGPDSEVFYEFTEVEHKQKFGEKCHPNCNCGRFLEIGNSVFMQYQKTKDGFKELPQKNVDFGGGLERLAAATENNPDLFQTSLFKPIIKAIEKETNKTYAENQKEMRIIADHFVASVMIAANEVKPSNKEEGYILRRLIRRGLDNLYLLRKAPNLERLTEAIVAQYQKTEPFLPQKYEIIKNVLLEEKDAYAKALKSATSYVLKKYEGRLTGGEILGTKEISAEDAFVLYSTHGLSPSQIKSLGYSFNQKAFAQKMEEHQKLSRQGAAKKFTGGLADASEKTIMGHTATHLLHKALQDLLGENVHQSGSNITAERVRFDFNFDRKLTDEEVKKIESEVNEKIKEDLPVRFVIVALEEAKRIGAQGLFTEKYQDKVKLYFIGKDINKAYSKELCGGPHVDFTRKIKSFKIIKQERLGHGLLRIYAKVGT